MSDPEQLGWRPSTYGNQYQNIQISEKSHLGNVYNISRDDPLSLLPIAENAPFDSYDKRHDPLCLPNTRTGVLHEIISWFTQDKKCIFWLNGAAGTGKSTIARTVARKYFKEKRLGASFFFLRGSRDASHAGKFFTSIAFQLASQSDILKGHICEAITKYRDIASKGLHDQWTRLIFQPLSKLEPRSPQLPFLVVIDALDECDEDNDIRAILQCLEDLNSVETRRLYICITSRPETPIRLGFRAMPAIIYHNLILHDVPGNIVDHDISIFFQEKFKELRDDFEDIAAEWPGEENISLLVQKAEGLFIYAATVYRFIKGDDEWPPQDLLDMFLRSASSDRQDKWKHNNSFTSPTWELDDTYTKILQYSFNKVQQQKDKVIELFKQVVGSVAIVSEPLSAIALGKLLDLPIQWINRRLQHLHSVLNIPNHQGGLIRLHHSSFRDFLLDKYRCSDLRYWVDEKHAHRTLADACVRLMSKSLMRDICSQTAPGLLVANIERSQIEQCIPLELRYACLYWIQHLQRSNTQFRDNGNVHQFLQEHFLHWLEVLGWMGKTSEGVRAILLLESHTLISESPNLHAFIHDAKRFALNNRSIIEQAPLQLYCSALVFAPGNSIVRKQFENYIPSWIQTKPKVQAHWNAALQTLEGHSGWVRSVAFSPDGQRVVSGSVDSTVRLWDAVTGVLQQTLESHSGWVRSVAFSPDGQRVASGSEGSTVWLWDAATGALQQTLEGHSGDVYSVAFSPNGQRVVSGSSNGTVRLWDAATGALQQTLESHSDMVCSVAFSPNGQRVVSGSSNGTVQLWDAVTDVLQQTLEGHSDWVSSVAFSPDSLRVVSGSYDCTVRLWDAVTGVLQQMLEGDLDAVYSVAFSPNGQRVVSGLHDNTVRLWDAATGALQQTLEGHSDTVCSVAFSPNGQRVVSGSHDNTVRLWDAATGALQQTLEGHSDWVSSVAFSPDSQRIVSGSDDSTVWLWDAATDTLQQTLEGHWDAVRSVAFSPNGQRVVSGSADSTVRLWDAATGALQQTLEGHSDWVNSVAFSPDGQRVVSGSDDSTVRLWDAATGVLQQMLESHSSAVYSVAFSPNGQRVVSGSHDNTVRLWDAATGALQQTLESPSDAAYSVAFSPDGQRVVSGSSNGTVRLWDAATGALQQTLEGHSDTAYSVAFSPDGQRVVSGSDDSTVRLWDAATGALQQTLECHSDIAQSIDISSNGSVRGLVISREWIAEQGANILWLPPDYRAASVAIWRRGNSVVLGHSSGNVSFLKFSLAPKAIDT
ncbi:putative F-box and wd40 domain protein [Bisporella sp. PMI_857]|nr:putative F-box and wd40 domain protein [Bisporella sp. PMI_857]